MPYASTDTARVHYTLEGDGPALVLLHGTGGDGYSHWGQLTRHLTPARRVICPDYAGSGRTTDHGGALTLDELVAQTLAVLDAEGLDRVDLAGYSLGAVIAAALAAIVKFTNWEGMARQTALDSQLDIRAELGGIVAPTQVIAGNEDQMVPRRLTDELADGIAGADRLTLPGGHLLPLEQPQALAEAILGFVTQGG